MLERVKPHDIKPEEFGELYRADGAGPAFNSINPVDAVSRLWEGSLILYRAPNRGVLAVEVNEGGDGTKRLNLVRMAGQDMALHFEEISRDLQHVAREHGCVAIETMVYDRKLAKALTRGGAQLESYTMVLELDNG